MKYLNKTFSVCQGGRAYGEGWDRTFGCRCDDEGSEPAATWRQAATYRNLTRNGHEVEMRPEGAIMVWF